AARAAPQLPTPHRVHAGDGPEPGARRGIWGVEARDRRDRGPDQRSLLRAWLEPDPLPGALAPARGAGGAVPPGGRGARDAAARWDEPRGEGVRRGAARRRRGARVARNGRG